MALFDCGKPDNEQLQQQGSVDEWSKHYTTKTLWMCPKELPMPREKFLIPRALNPCCSVCRETHTGATHPVGGNSP